MKKYKFITVSEGVHDKKYWRIRNNKSNDLIGEIHYYERWKQNVFTALEDAVWSLDCLKDVIDFMENEIPKVTP